MANAERSLGYRGYMVSRPVGGVSYPQRIQNLAIRELARRIGVELSFSFVEYAMPRCYMMLRELMNNVESLDGIIFFSLFTLPPQRAIRAPLFEQAIAGGKTLHFALENLSITNDRDVQLIEDVLAVAAVLPTTPFAGRYAKEETADIDTSFIC